jgi:hypothetical protein
MKNRRPVKTGEPSKDDAKGQFERRRSGSNPTRNPDGLHSANPVVTSGDGDATQPFKPGQKED